MARIENTVFISYRRTDTAWALAVFQYLTGKKYDVFFDYTSIASGDFEQIIVSNIKARAHFVLILTPTALDRCSEPGDWLRREIETAIDEKRNIIPLFFNGFSFGTASVSEKLVGKLRNLSRYNGLNVHQDYFREAMERLRKKFLNVPLDAVLFPLSTEVQKVVKEEQVAANRALLQSATGKQAEEKSFVEKQVTEKTPKPAPKRERSQKKKTEYETPRQQPKTESPKTENQPATQPKPAPVATPPNKLTLSNGMELMRVPSGKFLMGSKADNKLAGGNEQPQHTVDIPYDYWMARFSITNEQYNAYLKTRGIKHPVAGWEKKKDHPVTDVKWADVMAYCQWLNDLLKAELPAGLILRLPTEAEWEKAARGTDGNEYPWGNEFDKNKCNSIEGGKRRTTPVGFYSARGDSPYGCADMAGNVWECTHSLWKDYPYKANDGREAEKASGRRVLRGGSFYNFEGNARCAYRDDYLIDDFDSGVGFRVVASPGLS